jgi:hypothetical protein
VAVIAVVGLRAKTAFASPPQAPWQPSGFEGAWCAQGDPAKQCSIAVNGIFPSLTNENGSQTSGHFEGKDRKVIVGDQWNFVRGTLSPDGNRIDWSNGTFWARCTGGGGGGARDFPDVDGTWYRAGDRSKACYIRQRKRSLSLTNELGQNGTGNTDGRWHLSTNWSGKQVNGSISRDGNTIYWDNDTSWKR